MPRRFRNSQTAIKMAMALAMTARRIKPRRRVRVLLVITGGYRIAAC